MEDPRPDIILIVTDQQRYDTIRALGASHMDTPNIDRLVAQGVSFDQCHVTAPSCVPSRASLFSGYYPHTNGVLANGTEWSRTWVSDLADAGYHCVNIGKMHTIPYDAKAGFHERYVVENKDRFLEGRWFTDEWDKAILNAGHQKPGRLSYRARDDYRQALGAFEWSLDDRLHSDSFIGGFTEWWLDTKPMEKPLFLSIGFPGPHPPYDPTSEYAEKYMARDVPVPQVSQDELDRLPPPWQEKRRHDNAFDHDAVHWNLDPSEAELHRMRAFYYANVEMIDREVGRILDALERRGRLEQSVIIFTSDHGDNLGDHGLSQKWAPYEQVTRVPMVVSQPGRFPARRFDGLVQLFDLGPTILELAGLTPDDSFEARSLLDILEGRSDAARSHVYCEQGGDPSMTGADMVTMIRSRRHKLVAFLGQDYGQLFDLETDPGETQDLWDVPGAAQIKADLLGELGRWHQQSAYRTRRARAQMMDA